MNKGLKLLLFFMMSSVMMVAQVKDKKHIERLIDHGKYIDALEILNGVTSEERSYFLLRGICKYHTRDMDGAMLDLSLAYEAGEDSGKLLKYLAMTHHLRSEYVEASRAFKLYLNEIDRDDPERKQIIHTIKNCAYGLKAKYGDNIGFVENLGQVVNSPYDETSPIRSPNFENKYYFSSNRKGSSGGLRNAEGLKDDIYGLYSYDIYSVEQINGAWTPSTGVPPLINASGNDIIQGFSNNGRVLIFLKNNGTSAPKIVTDTFSTEVSVQPHTLNSPANGSMGDKDLFFVDDHTFIFSSKRRGGYGGYDLYITFKEDGSWVDPINLGPEINSPYDEVSPYLVNAGNLLYFSSNREESIGGFDVYSARYGIERGKWDDAQNLGVPVSSPGNDTYFRLSQDGRSAIFTSDRKESYGGYDLFISYLKNQVLEQLTYGGNVPFILREEESSGVSSAEVVNQVNEFNGTDEESLEEPVVSKVREMVLSPLLYNNNQNVIGGPNENVLKDVLDMMLIYPSVDLIITGHTNNDGSKAYDLYFSIKRAEQAAQYFISNGISEERILILGGGSSYPEVSRQGSNLATRNNQRIEIYMTAEDEPGLDVSYSYPVIADYLKANQAKEFREDIKGIHYRIVVNVSRQMYNNQIILNLKNVLVERAGNETDYQYTVGLFQSYLEALELKNELIRGGFLDVKMKAYKNGMRLSEEEMSKLSSSDQGLKDFIDHEIGK